MREEVRGGVIRKEAKNTVGQELPGYNYTRRQRRRWVYDFSGHQQSNRSHFASFLGLVTSPLITIQVMSRSIITAYIMICFLFVLVISSHTDTDFSVRASRFSFFSHHISAPPPLSLFSLSPSEPYMVILDVTPLQISDALLPLPGSSSTGNTIHYSHTLKRLIVTFKPLQMIALQLDEALDIGKRKLRPFAFSFVRVVVSMTCF